MLAWLFLIRCPSSQMTRSGPGRTKLPLIPANNTECEPEKTTWVPGVFRTTRGVNKGFSFQMYRNATGHSNKNATHKKCVVT